MSYRPSSAIRGLATVLMLLCAGRALASVEDDFNRARNAYTFGNYRAAIAVLRGLLMPLQLRDEDRIVEARQLLGVCYFFIKDYRRAEQQFERLLFLRPRHQLDPLLIPPPVIELFEKVRARLRDRLERLHPEARRRRAGPQVLVRRVQTNHLLLGLLPFGVGQFQNRRVGKAAFFLSAQVATLATNLITYAAAESLRRPDGGFAEQDLGRARNLRIAQITSLSAFGALVIWGIIDALVEYKPEVVLDERAVSVPAAARPPAAPATRPGRSDRGAFRLQWSAWASSESAGVGFGFRF